MAFLDKTGLKQVWAGTLTKLNDKVDKADYYGIVREEGGVVSAESLEGLAIGAVTHIIPKQIGEGEVSPDNVRKITGWDMVTLHRTNENLISHLEAKFTQGHINAIVTPEYIDVVEPTAFDYQRYDYIGLKAGRTYTLVIDCEAYGREEGNTKPMAVAWRFVAPGAETNSATITANGKYRFTTKYTPETDTRVNIIWNPNYGNIGDNKYIGCSRSSVMLLEGDYTTATAPAFIPCKKEVITTNLPETIYGGIYDWNTGLLIVTHRKVSLTGEESWIGNSGEILGQFYAEQLLLNNESMDSTKDGYCSHYQYGSAYQGTDKRVQGNGPYVWITDTSFTTVDELKTYLVAQVAAGTPVELVYPLATSYTIQLTPQQLIAIDGINFVRSDCGNTEASFNYTPFLNVVDNKVDKVEGMGLSTNDYTTAEKNKLRDIEDGANKTVIDSELSNDSINPVQNSTITAAIGTKANNSDLTSHINNESNPHNVTLNQLNVTATATELNFVSGTKSNIQTQLDFLSDAILSRVDITGWEWELGNIANTGANSTAASTTRARTIGYHYLSAGVTFSCLSGYSYNVFLYSAEDADSYITRSTVITTPYTLDRDCYVRVVAGYSPSADITDISQVANSLSLTAQSYITAERAENIIDARTYSVIGSPSVYLSDLVDGADYSNTTVQDLYNRYDALCTIYPQWIRRAADLGVASDGSEIRRYEVRLYDPIVSYERHFAVSGDGTYTNYWDSKIQYRRALLNAGAHGEERTACWGLLYFVEDLVKSDEPWALFIRSNYIIDIVPVLNPYGYNQGVRTNANGVNINSNFTADVPDPETQAMIDYLTENKGKLSCIIDCHTTRGNYGYVSTPESSPRMSQLMRLANQIFATCLTSWDEMAAQVGTSNAYTPTRPYMYACMAVGVNTVLYYALSHGITDKLLCIETTRPEGVKMGMVTKLTKDCLGNALPALLSI